MTEKVEKKLTRFERARLIGARATQIAQGAPFKIKLSDEDLKALKYNPVEIARLELEQSVIPLDVERPVPKRVKELEEETVPKA